MIALLKNNDNLFNNFNNLNVKLVDYRRNRLVNNFKSKDLDDFYTDSNKVTRKTRRRSRSKSRSKSRSNKRKSRSKSVKKNHSHRK